MFHAPRHAGFLPVRKDSKPLSLISRMFGTIGQAFADGRYSGCGRGSIPTLKIATKNAAENVMFMVNRAKLEPSQT